jgi:membrane-associated phospholipid phosphatase
LRRPYAVIAIAATVGVAIITAIVVMHPFLPIDATVEDDIQSVNWGPLALTFPIFTWIGDAKGAIAEAIVFVAILIFNRRAWITALGCSVSGLWYLTLSHIVIRARPTTAQVLHVTEHPGASSFPSGHTIFVITLVTVLMLCFGHRFLPRRVLPLGWVLAFLTVVACAISRIYSGAHWPTDVLASLLIATAWLSFVVSVHRVSDPALEPQPEKQKARQQAAAG